MSRYNLDHSTRLYSKQDHLDVPNPFQSKSFRIMRAVVITMFAITFILLAVFFFNFFANGGMNGFSYEVNYQFGNTSYQESYGYNTNR